MLPVAGGAPPQVALVPDPGTVLALAKKGAIQPLAPVIGSEVSDYGPAWNNLVTYNNKLYGVWFKAANKHHLVQPRRVRPGRHKDHAHDLAAAAH